MISIGAKNQKAARVLCCCKLSSEFASMILLELRFDISDSLANFYPQYIPAMIAAKQGKKQAKEEIKKDSAKI